MCFSIHLISHKNAASKPSFPGGSVNFESKWSKWNKPRGLQALIGPQVSRDAEVLIRTCSLQPYKPPRHPPYTPESVHANTNTAAPPAPVLLFIGQDSSWKFEMEICEHRRVNQGQLQQRGGESKHGRKMMKRPGDKWAVIPNLNFPTSKSANRSLLGV